MNNLIEQLDLYFGKKAPQLPAGFKEGIVNFAPYLVIIGLIFIGFSLITLFPLLLGLGVLGTALSGNIGGFFGILVNLGSSIIIGILYLMALPGLYKRTQVAWTYMFYGQIVSLLSAVLSFNIVGFIVGAVIGFYLLFQIRSYYGGSVPSSDSMTPPMAPPEAPPMTPPIA